MSIRSFDETFMLMAMELGEKGRNSAPPNPWVACLIVSETTQSVVAEGYHSCWGSDHAEVIALKHLKLKTGTENATGYTFYLTMEPCVHEGATPPCVDRVILSRPSRVVIGIEDPDARVSGRGVNLLKEAGIECSIDVCRRELKEYYRDYIYQRTTKLPYVVAKSACSINGLTSCTDGTSKWITSQVARFDAHQKLRYTCQGIIVGVQTVLADDCELLYRTGDECNDVNRDIRQPKRFILDPQCKLIKEAPQSKVLRDGRTATIIVISSSVPEIETPANKFEKHVSFLRIPCKATPPYTSNNDSEKTGRNEFCLHSLLRELVKTFKVIKVLIEGGPKTVSNFISSNLVSEMVVYYGAVFLGMGGSPCYMASFPETISKVDRSWYVKDVSRLSDVDVRCVFRRDTECSVLGFHKKA